MGAAQEGKTDACAAILASGQDVDHRIANAFGRTSLMMACKTGRVDTVKLLLEFRADALLFDHAESSRNAFGFCEECATNFPTAAQQMKDMLNLSIASLQLDLELPCDNRLLNPMPPEGIGPKKTLSALGPIRRPWALSALGPTLPTLLPARRNQKSHL